MKKMHLLVSHLDEGVQSLSIHLQELCLNVQHVNFCPGHHYSDKNTICGAQALETHRNCFHTGSRSFNISQFHLHAWNIYLHRFVQAFCKEGLLVPNAFHCKATTMIHCFRNTLQQTSLWGRVEHGRDTPTARKTSSREPDISLLMLSSMSFPEIFWYSSNTKGRRYTCIHPHSCRLVQWWCSLM